MTALIILLTMSVSDDAFVDSIVATLDSATIERLTAEAALLKRQYDWVDKMTDSIWETHEFTYLKYKEWVEHYLWWYLEHYKILHETVAGKTYQQHMIDYYNYTYYVQRDPMGFRLMWPEEKPRVLRAGLSLPRYTEPPKFKYLTLKNYPIPQGPNQQTRAIIVKARYKEAVRIYNLMKWAGL